MLERLVMSGTPIETLDLLMTDDSCMELAAHPNGVMT